jgi:hypothetical protein
VEGEKDVLALERIGAVATTAVAGAKSFHKVDATPLHGANVVAVVDNDDNNAGRDEWVPRVRKKLDGHAASLTFVQAAVGKDAADHIAAGHGVDDFHQLDLGDIAGPEDETAETATESPRPSSELLPVRRFRDIAAEVDARGPRKWLIRGIWPAGDYGVHGAEPKAGKTWNGLDLAVSVASGTPWLGAVAVDTTGPVLVFAGEGGDGNIVRRLRAIANARGLRAEDLPIWVCTRAPHLSSVEHLALLAHWIEQIGPALVILDPLYLAARGSNGADIYAMGAVLEAPQRICQSAGAALFIVTHYNRSRDLKGAARFTGAGPAEWGRVLLAAAVISRHTDTATKATTVLVELDVTGGEVPDQTLRIRRTITAVDPDDLDSALTYRVDVLEGDDRSPAGSGLPPAAVKLLEAVDALAVPATSSQLVDWIAEKYGHGLKRPTCSTQLNKLLDAGLIDCIERGGRYEKLWLRPEATT